MLQEIVGPAAQLEDVFERLYIQLSTLTQGTYDAAGDINEALRQLSEGKAQAADLCGYESRVSEAIEAYTSTL